MAAVPISHASLPVGPSGSTSLSKLSHAAKPRDWKHMVAAGSLIAGGALIVAGNRKAGLTLAAAGTAMVLLEDQESVATLWKGIPDYLSQAQQFLDRAEGFMTEFSVQGRKLQGFLRR